VTAQPGKNSPNSKTKKQTLLSDALKANLLRRKTKKKKDNGNNS